MGSTLPTVESSTALCPSCGGAVDEADEFCTHCGAHVAPLPIRAEQAERGPRRVPLLLAAAAGALLLAATGVSIYLALSYRSDLQDAEAELASSEAEVARLAEARAQLADRLEQIEALSQRRATVLRRADGVLRGIDPLLSSVDELKRLTGRIQASRDGFLDASIQATNALLDVQERMTALWNYTIDMGDAADPDYVDAAVDEVNAGIDTAFERISAARASARTLTKHDERYAKAASTFDTRASSLSDQVEALKQQLKAISGS